MGRKKLILISLYLRGREDQMGLRGLLCHIRQVINSKVEILFSLLFNWYLSKFVYPIWYKSMAAKFLAIANKFGINLWLLNF